MIKYYETVTELIILDNQLISVVKDQGFLHHLEFLNPQYAIPSRHYIILIPFWSCNVLAHQSRGSHTAEHVKHATEEMLNVCEIDKQCVHIILHDSVRNMKKAMDDMEVPSVGCVSHTSAAVHEGLLSQCSIIDLTANTKKVVGQCCSSICRIRKSHMKVYTLFQPHKKTMFINLGRTAWMQVLFFLMQLYHPRKY